MNKKLTAKEILDIIKKHYSKYSFAYGEWTELDKNIEIVLTEDEESAATDSDVAYAKMINHPGYRDIKKRDAEYESLSNSWDHLPMRSNIEEKAILRTLGLGEIIEVDRYGGRGEGELWYSVKYFKDHDVYIRIDGYYDSYNGAEFDQGYGYEVRPQKKMVTVYESATGEVDINL